MAKDHNPLKDRSKVLGPRDTDTYKVKKHSHARKTEHGRSQPSRARAPKQSSLSDLPIGDKKLSEAERKSTAIARVAKEQWGTRVEDEREQALKDLAISCGGTFENGKLKFSYSQGKVYKTKKKQLQAEYDQKKKEVPRVEGHGNLELETKSVGDLFHKHSKHEDRRGGDSLDAAVEAELDEIRQSKQDMMG